MKPTVSFLVPVLLAANMTYAAASNDSAVNVTPQERAKIEKVVHQYLVQKPEVLVESMQVLQKRQMDEANQTVKKTQELATTYAKELFQRTGDPIVGDRQGKVTVVEFFDYQCPHCVDMTPIMDKITSHNPTLRVVYKEFPIRGPASLIASKVALAANLQGKYLQMHNALMKIPLPLTEDAILSAAKGIGLDMDKLKKDMDGKAIDDELKATLKLAQDLKLFGTPAFFVGQTSGKGSISYVPGHIEEPQLQGLVNKANQS